MKLLAFVFAILVSCACTGLVVAEPLLRVTFLPTGRSPAAVLLTDHEAQPIDIQQSQGRWEARLPEIPPNAWERRLTLEISQINLPSIAVNIRYTRAHLRESEILNVPVLLPSPDERLNGAYIERRELPANSMPRHSGNFFAVATAYERMKQDLASEFGIRILAVYMDRALDYQRQGLRYMDIIAPIAEIILHVSRPDEASNASNQQDRERARVGLSRHLQERPGPRTRDVPQVYQALYEAWDDLGALDTPRNRSSLTEQDRCALARHYSQRFPPEAQRQELVLRRLNYTQDRWESLRAYAAQCE